MNNNEPIFNQLDKKPYGIIYKMKNNINNKVYIGQTTTSIKDRVAKHFSEKRNRHITNALKKYGKDNFNVSIICEIFNEDQSLLNNAEIAFIHYYKSYDSENGYNKTFGGNQIGKLTNETKEKLSKSKKLYKFTEEHKKNISIATKKAMQNEKLKNYLSNNKKKFYENMSEEERKKFFKNYKGVNAGKKKPPRTIEHSKKLANSIHNFYEDLHNKQIEYIKNIDKNILIEFRQKTKYKLLYKEFNKQFNIKEIFGYNITQKILIQTLKKQEVYYAN